VGMIDNCSILFEDSINKPYINPLNHGELEKILSILDLSYDEDDRKIKKKIIQRLQLILKG
tara:strand:- start:576 stop:758 length:183 start_codon:yes stop_codon:yes gene_type:complete